MMSCLWILVFGSLIATGVRTQEGEAEGSEETNTSTVAADLPPAEEDDPALSEDGDAGSPEAATEEAATTATPEDTEEPAETEAEPEMTASEQDETTDSPSDETEKPITEAPEMNSKTAEPGLFQEETYTLKDKGPEGGESDPSEGDSDLSDHMNETQTQPEERETKSTVHQANVEEISAGNSIGDTGSPSEGAGTVRSAGAVAEPNGLGSGTVAGVVAAIGVAIIGAISSYLTYQKKLLCFKVQRRDPERPKEENGTQNDPQEWNLTRRPLAGELIALLMEHTLLRLQPLGLFVLLIQSQCLSTTGVTKPNFILMMVDDLGIGDVGCYGNDTIKTPNIDRLALDGVKLTQHIAAAPLCTPSRTAFMTGRYALRSGLGSTGRVQVILFLGGSGGLPPSEITFARLLQKQGYSTGIVGKWHLGVNCQSKNDYCHHPNNHGFDYFYGLPFTNFNDCKPGEGTDVLGDLQVALWQLSLLVGLGFLTLILVRLIGLLEVSVKLLTTLAALCLLGFVVWYVPFGLLRTWNCIIMRNYQVVEQPMNLDTLNERLMMEAEQFVERNRNRPFLLFLSLAHVHTPLFISRDFAGKSKHGLYGDNVEEMDWMIGRMVKTIENHNLSERTLMYFTSDHGGHIEDSDTHGQKGGWNGIYRGGKAMGGWEGGIRVPGIFRWQGRLPSGRVVDEPTSLMDLYPTLVKLAGGELPQDRVLDGHDLMPLLEGKAERSEHEFMFHYCGVYLNAVRWNPLDSNSVFKLHFFTPNFFPPGAIGCYHTKVCMCHGEFITQHDPPLMFDLSRDPAERVPLTGETEPRYAEVLQRVLEAVEVHRQTLRQVENQLSWGNILWKPWLQPCCGTFPFCSCSEDNSTCTRTA